jgi:threonine dehydrogenase-like Zn-dependent dehydrogenase
VARPGDIRFDEVPDPANRTPTDAVVAIATGAICGTDLHIVRGTKEILMANELIGRRVAFLASNEGVERPELVTPGRR